MNHDTLQTQGKALPLVSVIIPMYNAEEFIQKSVRSVQDQTYQQFEIIIVDDGSSDNSAGLVRELMREDARIRMISIENHGQGYARNLAFGEARGKYVLFLDADDAIEATTLELAVAKLEEEKSDLAVFNWVYYERESGTRRCVNKDSFFEKDALCGEDCLELLSISPIFAVNKLYRASFLKENEIRFSEGHIYEDNPFWIRVSLCAEMVSLIPSPLYIITLSNTSSTKTGIETDWHCFSYIKAMEEILDVVKDCGEKLTDYYKYVLTTNLYSKFTYYYSTRTPKKYQKKFIADFLPLMGKFGEISDYHRIRSFSCCLKYKVFSKQRTGLFSILLLLALTVKPKLEKIMHRK